MAQLADSNTQACGKGHDLTGTHRGQPKKVTDTPSPVEPVGRPVGSEGPGDGRLDSLAAVSPGAARSHGAAPAFGRF